jgi:hypothetical protein
MRKCIVCGGPFYAKELCIKCYHREYARLPRVKKRVSSYGKKYYQRPYVKEKHRLWAKKYARNPDVKAIRKEYSKYITCPSVACRDFKKYSDRIACNLMRTKGEEIDKEELARSFVKSVEQVIDGGLELKVAKKLGVIE